MKKIHILSQHAEIIQNRFQSTITPDKTRGEEDSTIATFSREPSDLDEINFGVSFRNQSLSNNESRDRTLLTNSVEDSDPDRFFPEF